MRADAEKLTIIKGLGEITAENIINYFKDDKNLMIIQKLLKYHIKGI